MEVGIPKYGGFSLVGLLPVMFLNAVLLLLLSRFSRVRLCATPQTAAHQASPVPGILQFYFEALNSCYI